jgi:apolipoprotein N-acyltransferase
MRYLIAGLSGLALVFAFAPFGFYPLAWVALAPLLMCLWDTRLRSAFKIGLAMGIPYFFGTTYWIYHSMHDFGGIALVPSLFIVLALALYLALYPAFFGYLFSLVMRETQLPALLVAPVFWVSLEYLRSYFITGFTWSGLGYTQWNFLPAIQFADLTGVYGVSFLLVAVNGALADFYILRERVKRMPLFPLYPTVLGFAALLVANALVFSYGVMKLESPANGKTVKVSIVQGSIDQPKKWDPRFEHEVLSTYMALTNGASFETPQLIVWPEAALPFPYNEWDPRVDRLKEYEASLNTPLLLGAVREKERGSGQYANSVVLINAGKTSFIYDKIHMVPFGEYVPLERVLFFVNKLSDAIGNFRPGTEYTKGVVPGIGRFGAAICYEITFPGLVRKFFKDGGDFLVTVTNDAWFGRSSGPYQHFSMAVLRAVENRKPVIRAANSGISGFIASDGQVLKKTRLFERKVVTAELKTDSKLTLYSRYGDWFSYFCILGAVFFLIFLL